MRGAGLLDVTQFSEPMRLSRPCLRAPEGIAGEAGSGDEEDHSEDKNAGHDHPAAFEAVDAGVQKLNQGDKNHQVAESTAGAETEQDKELRKKAIFWLGQSHDPRAAQALLKIIDQ